MSRPSEPATHLNSIWLEGTVVAEPREGLDYRGAPAWWFRVRSQAPPQQEAPSEFLVEASDGALDGSRARVVRGRGVRIIGRLTQHRWRDGLGHARSEVKIVSELVEAMEPR